MKVEPREESFISWGGRKSDDSNEGWIEEGEDGYPALEFWVVIVWESDGSEGESGDGELLTLRRGGKSVEGKLRKRERRRRFWDGRMCC